MPASSEFATATERIVKLVPHGKVVTYGQVAALIGAPRGARMVGWTAHWGDPEVPWHRVVNRHGRVAPGYPGGFPAHAAALREEDIAVNENDWTVPLERFRWHPPESVIESLQLPEESIAWLEAHVPFSKR